MPPPVATPSMVCACLLHHLHALHALEPDPLLTAKPASESKCHVALTCCDCSMMTVGASRGSHAALIIAVRSIPCVSPYCHHGLLWLCHHMQRCSCGWAKDFCAAVQGGNVTVKIGGRNVSVPVSGSADTQSVATASATPATSENAG